MHSRTPRRACTIARMDLVQIGIATATALVALYWWRRIARFMDTVENRIRDIDDKLTRRDD